MTPTQNEYFWALVDKIHHNNPDPYIRLFYILHSIEYSWLVEGDENRAVEGMELRAEYSTEGYDPAEGCSVFEMFIAFANRCAFQTEDTPEHWFWIFIKNMGLADRGSPPTDREIERIVSLFLLRTPDEVKGIGNMFPLRHRFDPNRELWFLFFDYLNEN